MIYTTEGGLKQKYHLVCCDNTNEVLTWFSFYHKSDRQFYILDEISQIADFILKDHLEKYHDQVGLWTRDISVHQLTYYDSFCEGGGWPYHDEYGETIYQCYFFTDDYMCDSYFKEYYDFLIEHKKHGA